MSFGTQLKKAPQRAQEAQTRTVPAPVGGINARDALAAMPETDAVILDNGFCLPSYVQLPRNGSTNWATGFPTYVETVMAYNGPATRKLFGVSNGNIYDATTSGAIGAALVTGLGTSRLQHAMFNAGGGNFLLWVDGVDTPQVYNGTAWAASTASGTGLTPSNLITVTVHQQRCWYIENNTTNVWYTAPLAFQGVLTLLPLGQLFVRGGYLMQMASWTIDNVEGINAYAAFITSEGEVAIYQGYDPSQVATWALVGVFKIGRPIGRRCLCKFGSDVLCITADGLTPLSKALLTDRTQPETQVTYKIRNAVNLDLQSYAANFGWQVIEHPIGTKLIINVPEQVDVASHQWVKNTVRPDDGGWSRFRNWNASCWEVQQDALYYGGNTVIVLADTGPTDVGSPISVDVLPAFSIFDLPGQQKIWEYARAIFLASSNFAPNLTLNVDYNAQGPANIPLTVGTAATWLTWESNPWDTQPWGDVTPAIPVKAWQGVSGFGYAASGRLTMQMENLATNWFQTDYIFQEGGPL